jgi:hypothetical protein
MAASPAKRETVNCIQFLETGDAPRFRLPNRGALSSLTSMLHALARFDERLRALPPGSPGFLLACAIPALAVATYLGSLQVPRLVRLAASGASATATVTFQACSRHGVIGLRLETGGHGVEVQARVPQSQCARARVGDRVPVAYLPADPSVVAITADARVSLARELAAVLGIGGCGTFAGVAVVLLAARRARRPGTGARGP